MSKIRTIKPEFWTSEQIANISRDARLLFIGIWNFCDDSGVHPANIHRLKTEIFPGNGLSKNDIVKWIQEIKENDLIEEYEINGKNYWLITGWQHQRIDNPTYKYPLPTGHTPVADKSPTGRRRVPDESATCRTGRGEEGNGKEGKGKEWVGEGGDDTTDSNSAHAREQSKSSPPHKNPISFLKNLKYYKLTEDDVNQICAELEKPIEPALAMIQFIEKKINDGLLKKPPLNVNHRSNIIGLMKKEIEFQRNSHGKLRPENP